MMIWRCPVLLAVDYLGQMEDQRHLEGLIPNRCLLEDRSETLE